MAIKRSRNCKIADAQRVPWMSSTHRQAARPSAACSGGVEQSHTSHTEPQIDPMLRPAGVVADVSVQSTHNKRILIAVLTHPRSCMPSPP